MEKKVKILHAITRLDRGGSSANTLLSAMGLAEKGYDVDLLFGRTENADTSLLERAKASGVRFIKEGTLIRHIHPVWDTISFFKIARLMRQNRYDIVHAHSSKAGLICRVAAKCAGIKRIVYTPHGHVFYGYFGKISTRLIIFVEAMAVHITDRIIGLTPAECDEWRKFGIGRKEMYVPIPSGIEFDELKREADEGTDWRVELGIPRNAALIGSIGRFIEIKGYRYFIEAAIEQMRKRNDVHFLLAGDGPLREEYRGMISAEGLERRFHMISWQENIGAIINGLDIFVLSSLNEGMGRVLVEAMFLGKPVIATNVGGVSSVLSDDTGFLVEPASSPALCRAIDKLLDGPEKAGEMGRKGHEKALSGYSARKMVDGLDALYRELF